REICSALNIKSTSTAHKDIESLVKQGYLVKDPSKPRALMVVDPSSGKNEKHVSANTSNVEAREDIVDVPVVGRVAAGTPILAEENVEDSFPIPARFATSGTNFMLRVKGESMIEAGIMDGDLILVQQTETARNGEMVVAMIDGFENEATVKTFYKEKDFIRLQPENSTMSPIIVKDVKILGKVKGVFRYFN
ncbi:MAG: transcriptional repressor LexA, partial [Firmicutes bacterium]|nr:transcriptional repressor LexA [Bacillota bacterium]